MLPAPATVVSRGRPSAWVMPPPGLLSVLSDLIAPETLPRAPPCRCSPPPTHIPFPPADRLVFPALISLEFQISLVFSGNRIAHTQLSHRISASVNPTLSCSFALLNPRCPWGSTSQAPALPLTQRPRVRPWRVSGIARCATCVHRACRCRLRHIFLIPLIFSPPLLLAWSHPPPSSGSWIG